MNFERGWQKRNWDHRLRLCGERRTEGKDSTRGDMAICFLEQQIKTVDEVNA